MKEQYGNFIFRGGRVVWSSIHKRMRILYFKDCPVFLVFMSLQDNVDHFQLYSNGLISTSIIDQYWFTRNGLGNKDDYIVFMFEQDVYKIEDEYLRSRCDPNVR